MSGFGVDLLDKYRRYVLTSGYQETNASVSPGLVVGAIQFDPSVILPSLSSDIRLVSFNAILSVTPGMTATLELFNQTDATVVATVTSTAVNPTLVSQVLIAADFPNASKLYVARLYISAGAPGPADRAMVYNCFIDAGLIGSPDIFLRADDVDLVGGAVSNWPDQGIQANDLSQGTAGNRPGYTAGTPSVDFSIASNTHLERTSLTQPTAYTMTVIGAFGSLVDNQLLVDLSNGFAPDIITTGGNILLSHPTVGFNIFGPTTVNLQCLDAVWTGAQLWTRTNGAAWTVGIVGAVGGWNPGLMSIGAYNNGVFPSTYSMREFRFYRRQLSTQELAMWRLFDYGRYGV